MINLTKNSISIPTATVDELHVRACCLAGRRRSIFGAKLEALRQKIMLHFLHFLQPDMAFGIVNPFSLIVDAISSENSDFIAFLFNLRTLTPGIRQDS